jgi:hypothetical protein
MKQFQTQALRKWNRLKDRFSNDSLPMATSNYSSSSSFNSSSFSKKPNLTGVTKFLGSLSTPSWIFIIAAFLIMHGVYLNITSSTRTQLECAKGQSYCEYTLTNYKGGGRLGELYSVQQGNEGSTKNKLSVYFLRNDLLSSNQVRLSRNPGSNKQLGYPDDDITSTTDNLSRIEKRKLGYGYEIMINVHIPTGSNGEAVTPESYVLSKESLKDKSKGWVKSKSVNLPMSYKSMGRKSAKNRSASINNFINTIHDKGSPSFLIKESTGYSLRGILECVLGMVTVIGVAVWWLIDDDVEEFGRDGRNGKWEKGR